MREVDNYIGKTAPGRETRLVKEWDKIDRYCCHDKDISYIIRKRNPKEIPIAYEIIFEINSITGVEEPDEQGLQKPVFGNKHTLRINIPNNYPNVDGGYPEAKFISDVWHPNVRYFGDFKGRVCLNYEDSGTETNLIDYIDRIANYLRYTDYHAINEYPYPEDQTVAQWVLEQAEPQGWLNFYEDEKSIDEPEKV